MILYMIELIVLMILYIMDCTNDIVYNIISTIHHIQYH